MNSEYIIERLIAYALLVLIPLICYFLAGKLLFRSKHKGKIKRYLTILIASLICFLFFIVYSILANEFDLSVKILNPLYFVLVPISFLSIVIFFILFFFNKNIKAAQWAALIFGSGFYSIATFAKEERIQLLWSWCLVVD